jgi:hypothetical protein
VRSCELLVALRRGWLSPEIPIATFAAFEMSAVGTPLELRTTPTGFAEY